MTDQSGTETNPMFTQLLEMAHKKQLQGDLAGALTLLKSALTLEGVPEVQMREAQLMADGLEARLQPVAPEPTAEESPTPEPVRPAKSKRKWWKTCLIILLAVIGLCVVGGGLVRLISNAGNFLAPLLAKSNMSNSSKYPGRVEAFNHWFIPSKGRSVITSENAGQLQEVGQIGKEEVQFVEYSSDGKMAFVAGYHTGFYIELEEDYEDDIDYYFPNYMITTMAVNFEQEVIAFGLEENYGLGSDLYLYVDSNFPYGDGEFLSVKEDIYSLDISRAGDMIAVGTYDHLYLVDVDTLNTIRQWELDDLAVNGVAFSPDGKLLAGGLGKDHSVRIWQVSDGEELQNMTWHTDSVLDVAFGADGKTLFSGSRDGTVRQWDVASGELLTTFTGVEGSKCFDIDIDSEEKYVACGSNYWINVWQISDQKRLWDKSDFSAWSVAFRPGEDELAVVNDELGILQIVKPRTGRVIKTYDGSLANIELIDGGNSFLITKSTDGALRSWDLQDYGRVDWTYFSKTGFISDLRINHIRDRVLLDQGSQLVLLRSSSGAQVWTKTVGDVQAIGFSADDSIVYTCNTAGEIVSRQSSNGKEISTIDAYEYYIERCAFSPDGTTYAMTLGKEKVQIGSTSTNSTPRIITGFPGGSEWLVFSPDGKWLLAQGDNKNFDIWDIDSEKMIMSIADVVGYRVPAFNPDGSILVYIGAEDSLRLWDLRTNSLLAIISKNVSQVKSMNFSSNGDQLFINTGDGIHIFEVPPADK